MSSAPDLAQVTQTINGIMQERGAKTLPRDLAAQLRADNLKRCPGCATVKPFEEFAAKKSNSDGLQPRCRACSGTYHREYYNRDPQAQVKRVNTYRETNPITVRISNGKIRAREFGVPYEEFTYRDLLDYWESVGIDPWVSAYSGTPLTADNYGIDHVVPLSDPNSPGHRKELLVPCTQDENRRKATGHWIYLLNNELDPADLPDLVKQALEPTTPERKTVLLHL